MACRQPRATCGYASGMRAGCHGAAHKRGSARVLDHFGVTLKEISGSTCCGAINHHLNAHEEAMAQVRANVDVWWKALDDGADAIVITASGCGAMVRDYARLLADDKQYSEKSARVTAHVKDLAEFVGTLDIEGEDWSSIKGRDVAYHPPCTLQHGQSLPGVAESVLRRVGVELKPVADSHLCCGSAGTYSSHNRNCPPNFETTN